MVWRAHAESLEQAARVKRVFGGKRERCIGGMRGIRAGNGNTGVYLFTFYSVRVHGVAAYVWFCAEDRRNGVELDDG
jgi:hypothetical protein